MMTRKVENVHKAITAVLCELGEKCVEHARNLPSMRRDDPMAKFPHQPNYIDSTGNLRSSVGYGVYRDGQQVMVSPFEQVKDGADGTIEGRKLLDKLATKFPSGYVLIVVAGMNYAYYVEARGYDVLSSSELLAERELPRMINDLFD